MLRAAWVGGLVLAVGLAGTAAWAVLTKRQYRSEALLAYEHGVQAATAGTEGESGRQITARLQEMLTARQRLEAVVRRMRLYPSIVEQRNIADAVDEMRKHLTFVPREGDAYKVTFDSESREVAQKVLDTLIKGALEEDRVRRLREADDAKKFLEAERKRADDDLKAKEAVLSEFISRHPKYASEAGGGATVGIDERSKMRDALTAGSGLEVADLKMRMAQIDEQIIAAGAVPSVPGRGGADPIAVEARARAEADLRAAQLDLSAKQVHYTPEHPDVKAAFRHVSEAKAALQRAEAAVIDSKMANNAQQVVPAVEHVEDSPRVQALKSQRAAIQAQISLLQSRSGPPTRTETARTTGGSVATETQWTGINRDVAEARERQAQLESRSFQAQFLATLVSGGQAGRIIVVDPPFVPLRPVAGTRSKIALVGAAAATMAALLAMVLIALFDDRLYGSRDVERVVSDAFVVVIPRLTEKGG
jgi:uncharacterized protein involved in exopolysaccharide biosynthesis